MGDTVPVDPAKVEEDAKALYKAGAYTFSLVLLRYERQI